MAIVKIEEMIDFLKQEVSERRFIHSINTMNTAKDLARRLGVETEKCEIAGLLHDCAKNIIGSRAIDMCKQYKIDIDYILRKQTNLLHGYLGRIIAMETFDIEDEEILNAIAYHTMGRPGMSMIERVVFLADYIEPHRFYPGVEELREMAYKKPEVAIINAIDGTLKKIISRGELLHPQILETRNYYISIQGEY